MKITKLLEANEPLNLTPDARVLLSEILDKCQQQIRAGGSGLYRGVMAAPNEHVFKEPIRTDRISRSHAFFQTHAFNMAFEEMYGIPNLRNRAAFVTNVPKAANFYGTLHFAFIPDGAKMVYRPQRSDTMSTLSSVGLETKQFIRQHTNLDAMFKFAELMGDVDVATNLNTLKPAIDEILKGSSITSEDVFKYAIQQTKSLIGDYQVAPPSAIPSIPTNGEYGTEVMVIDTPCVYLVSTKLAAHITGVPVGSNYQSMYNELLDFLVMDLE